MLLIYRTLEANKLLISNHRIVLLYDTDKTGMESSKKHEKQLSEYGVKHLLLPLAGTKKEKDVSDYFRMGNSRTDFMILFPDFVNASPYQFPHQMIQTVAVSPDAYRSGIGSWCKTTHFLVTSP